MIYKCAWALYEHCKLIWIHYCSNVGVSTIFKMVLMKSLMLTKAAYLIKNTIETVILWDIVTIQNNCLNIFKNTINYLMQSWIFSVITPGFSVTWSFRNHFLFIFIDILKYKLIVFLIYNFLLLSMLKTVVLLNIFVEIMIHLFQDYLMNGKFKWKFCNIINVFTVTSDQFNASLVHNSINLFKKIFLTPNDEGELHAEV